MSDRLRFKQGQLFHMTLIDRLPAILDSGRLLCDAALVGRIAAGQQIAHEHLKRRRMTVHVPVPPRGVVADYVPFYLAPRSPMLFANFAGNVEGRQAGQDGIVYLVTTIKRLPRVCSVVLTNKHPLKRATFTDRLELFDDQNFIDWDVMFDPYWPSQVDTERPDRRQAEVLAHGHVPLEAILGVAARTSDELDAVRNCVEDAQPDWHLSVRPDWYF